MNTSVPSEQQLLMAGYVLGDLDVEESLAFEQLLSNNPALQQELIELQASLDTVYGQEIAPPPALKASVLAAAEQAMQTPVQSSIAQSPIYPSAAAQPSVERTPLSEPERIGLERIGLTNPAEAPARLTSKFLLLATGVLAVLSLYLGSQNYRLRLALREVQLEQAAESVDSAAELVTYSLDTTENATEDEQTSSVEISIDRDRLEAVLAVSGLPPLPEGQVYCLWTVIPADAPVTKDAKNAVLTAVFTVDETGEQTREIVLPSVYRDRTPVEAIAVTVEDADAPQDHESSPILIRRL